MEIRSLFHRMTRSALHIKRSFMVLSSAIWLTGCSDAPWAVIEAVLDAGQRNVQSGFPLESSPGVVVRVVDADTFVVRVDDADVYESLRLMAEGDRKRIRYLDDHARTIRIRLGGVDTPESVHPDRSRNTEKGKALSRLATSMLQGHRTQVSCYDWGHYGG